MKLFNSLLKLKTDKTYLIAKAIYIPYSKSWGEWGYYIYYYDLEEHTFYINDLAWPFSPYRASVINVIEKIITKAYRQELFSYGDAYKELYSKKIPKVLCFYRQKMTQLIIIDTIKLQAIRNKNWEIIRYKNPLWDNDNIKINEAMFKENRYS